MTIIYFGASLNSLVSIERQLKNQNINSVLFTNMAPLGAHFSGININGSRYENGMTYFEFPESANEHIKKYQADKRYGWLPFVKELRNYVESFVDIYETFELRSFVNDRLYSDYFISDNLDILKSIKVAPPKRMSLSNPIHPSNKTICDAWKDLLYTHAISYAHGAEFNFNLIDPYLTKMLDKSKIETLLARYHRLLWLPLFYPETISVAATNPNSNCLRPYKFYNTFGGVSEFVSRIVKKIRFSEKCQIIDEKITNVVFKGTHCKVVTEDNVYNFSVERSYNSLPPEFWNKVSSFTFKSEYLPDKTGIDIVYCKVNKEYMPECISTVNIISRNCNAIRLTNFGQDEIDKNMLKVVLEYPRNANIQLVHNDTSIAKDMALVFAVEIPPEAIHHHHVLNLPKALNVPTSNTVQYYSEVKKFFDSIDSFNTFASVTSLGAASLNDQIAQGIFNEL